jgi:hypothetical protein
MSSDRYESPFAFTGKIKRILVDVSDAEFKDLGSNGEGRDGDAVSNHEENKKWQNGAIE